MPNDISDVVELDVLPTEPSPMAKAMSYKAAAMHGSDSFSDAGTSYFSYGAKGASPVSQSYTMSPSENVYGRRSGSSARYDTSPRSLASGLAGGGDSCCPTSSTAKTFSHKGGGCC